MIEKKWNILDLNYNFINLILIYLALMMTTISIRNVKWKVQKPKVIKALNYFLVIIWYSQFKLLAKQKKLVITYLCELVLIITYMKKNL